LQKVRADEYGWVLPLRGCNRDATDAPIGFRGCQMPRRQVDTCMTLTKAFAIQGAGWVNIVPEGSKLLGWAIQPPIRSAPRSLAPLWSQQQ
jgi:hypothetical protein